MQLVQAPRELLDTLMMGIIAGPDGVRYEQFIKLVPGNHLILLRFSCGCWRFIEVKAKMQRSTKLALFSTRIEYTWSYLFPETNIECGARIVDKTWLQLHYKVFVMDISFEHRYADFRFREQAKTKTAIKHKQTRGLD